jgi:hypothetical protein
MEATSAVLAPAVGGSPVDHVLEIWRNNGVEVTIFVLTLSFAVVFNWPRKGASKKVAYCNHGLRAAASADCPRAALDLAVSKPRKLETRSNIQLEPWQMVEEIIDGVREQPGERFAQKAISMYSTLKSSPTWRGKMSLADATRRSRYSSEELYTTLMNCAVQLGRQPLVEELTAEMRKQGIAPAAPRPSQ